MNTVELPYTIPDTPVDLFTIRWFTVTHPTFNIPQTKVESWEAQYHVGVCACDCGEWAITQNGNPAGSARGWNGLIDESWGNGGYSDIADAHRSASKILKGFRDYLLTKCLEASGFCYNQDLDLWERLSTGQRVAFAYFRQFFDDDFLLERPAHEHQLKDSY